MYATNVISVVRACFRVLALVSCIALIVLISRLYNRGKHGQRFRDFRLALQPTPRTWEPNPETLRKLLAELNQTTNVDPSLLPLTLHTKLLLSNANLCRTDDGGPVDFLFFVHTAPQNIERRLRMRKTFTSPGYFLPLGFNVRRVFLLGLVKDKALQNDLEVEHRLFGDLVQGNFLDSYRNLTNKGVMGFGWMTRYCPHARLVIKTDDDVFFDTFKLIRRFWPLMKDKKRSIFCKINRKFMMGIMRKGKWSVDENIFSTHKEFPYDYCSGLTVLISGDLVPWLHKAAEFSPLFWIDDLYLFGILPAVASNVSFFNLHFHENFLSVNRQHTVKCLETNGYNCPILASITNSVYFEQMWNISRTRYGLSYLRSMDKPRVVV